MPSSFTERNSQVGYTQPNCQQPVPSPCSQENRVCLFGNVCGDSFPAAWVSVGAYCHGIRGAELSPVRTDTNAVWSIGREHSVLCMELESLLCLEGKSLGQQQPSAFKSLWVQLCCPNTQRPWWWPGSHHSWHCRGQECGTALALALVTQTGDGMGPVKGLPQRCCWM